MNRFWKRNSQPLHDVTHRAIGDIPGCTMAPEDSIFRPITLEQARVENSVRADRFIHALDNDQYGPSFRGSSFAEPIFGAYGEQL